ncbi:hypothetical protein ACR31S_01380 [Streptococcus iniae]
MLEVVTEELLNYQNNRLQVYQKGNQNIDKDATIFVGDSIIEFYPLKNILGAMRQSTIVELRELILISWKNTLKIIFTT